MATHLKQFETILIPFKNGFTITDSQGKPRMYKTRKSFEKTFPKHNYGTDGVELVEFAEVRHGRWILKAHDERINFRWNVTAYCSECCDEECEIWAGFFPGVPDFMANDIALDSARVIKLSDYCPNCGAKMDAEVKG